MRAVIVLVAMSAFVTAWLPASANADCGTFNKKWIEVQNLKARVLRELERVRRMNPRPQTDQALCGAASAMMTHADALWRNPEPSCFESRVLLEDAVAKIREVANEARQMVQMSCRH